MNSKFIVKKDNCQLSSPSTDLLIREDQHWRGRPLVAPDVVLRDGRVALALLYLNAREAIKVKTL